ncbi:MAG TPA: redoxin domain-containing protein [Polyangiaceae bacterium]
MKSAALLAAALALAACGTNRPELPEELLRDPGGSERPDYPDGPYGTEPGGILADATFPGWRAPLTSEHTEDALTDIAFSDYHDPDGSRYELLLVNTAALWCSVCQSEHQTLPERHAEYSDRGVVLVSALFQDEGGDPADLNDLKRWVERFDVPFPMLLDADFQLGIYATAETAPLNLLVDARSMRILEKFVGDSSTTLWQRVDDELAEREAETVE